MKEEKDILFRDKEFKDISNLLATLEGIKLHGAKGLGTSKMLRYIHANTEIKNKYFSSFVTHYVDLCTTSNLDILKRLSEKESNLVILNTANRLSELPENEILFLRSLKYDKGCAFILGYNNESKLSNTLKPILDICPHEYEILPLDTKRMILTIKDMLRVWNKKLKYDEIENIAKLSKGSPSIAKEQLSKKLFSQNIKSSDIFEDKLTKNEFLIFQMFKKNLNELTKRDDIAFELSPESKGDGVSNEAIDQIVKRIRKKLKDHQSELTIVAKRGFGYILKSN